MKLEELSARPRTTAGSTKPEPSRAPSASMTSRRAPASAHGRKHVTSQGGKPASALHRPVTSASTRPGTHRVMTSSNKTFFTVPVRSKFLTDSIHRPATSRSRTPANGSVSVAAGKPRRVKRKQSAREKSDYDTYNDDGEQTTGTSRDVTADDDVRQAGMRQLNAMLSARSQLDDIFNDLTDNVTALGKLRDKPLPTGSSIFEEVLHELVHLAVTPEPSLASDDVAPVLDTDFDLGDPALAVDGEEEEEEQEGGVVPQDDDVDEGDFNEDIEHDGTELLEQDPAAAAAAAAVNSAVDNQQESL